MVGGRDRGHSHIPVRRPDPRRKPGRDLDRHRPAVAGNALDLSGLTGQQICSADTPTTCIDQATLGGFGSAIAYTGFDNVFVAVPDRGPFDGRTNVPYRDRFNFLHLTVNVGAAFPNIRTLLLDTRFLKAQGNQSFVGDSSAFDLRFDPEGAAISRDGTFFVSDEYGPAINEFNRQGHLIRRIAVPEKFLIEHPTGDVDNDGNSFELYPSFNVSGRQANRGMEGLAITPDGRYLVGIMQNALLQDNGLNSAHTAGPTRAHEPHPEGRPADGCDLGVRLRGRRHQPGEGRQRSARHQ